MIGKTPAPHSTLKNEVDAKAIEQAVHTLNTGELVAFPTETVYGLGADATNPAAIARLFALKGRPSNHPVIVHLPERADPAYWVNGALPSQAQALIDAFWPGPLTLILKRAPYIPQAVSGGQDSIGLRCPAHPVAQTLLQALQNSSSTPRGLAAPSANRFGRVSPTTAQHVRDEFGVAVSVLDGGACSVGIESTILDLSRAHPVVLRAGQVGVTQLAEVLGVSPQQLNGTEITEAGRGSVLPKQDEITPRAPGTLKAHYAPRIPLFLLTVDEIGKTLEQRAPDERVALIVREPSRWNGHVNLMVVAAPVEPEAYARDLYRLLRQLENADVQYILVETLPTTVAWMAINDRLSRAAAAFKGGD